MASGTRVSPLKGVRVLDFTRILAGPYCSMVLGDLGAEVIKVERAGVGDDTRKWHPPSVNGESAYFLCLNRNKKSLTLDLKKPRGLAVARELASHSDVLLENFIPGTMSNLGLDFETLTPIAPRLIYCSITGYGPTGPWARRGGYDVIAAAIGGFLNMTGPSDGEPCKPGVAVTDLLTGLYAHGAIMAALIQRGVTGRGQKIDCNLLSTQIASLVNIGSNYLNCGTESKRWGTAHESIVPYQAFRTKDGRFMVVGAGNDGQFRELASLIQMEELLSDPRFKDNNARVEHRQELIELLKARFRDEPASYWEEKFCGSTMPSGKINNLEEAFSHPQVLANQCVQTMTHPTAGEVKVTGPAVRYSDAECSIRSPPPLLGQHTESILKTILNKSDREIDELRTHKII